MLTKDEWMLVSLYNIIIKYNKLISDIIMSEQNKKHNETIRQLLDKSYSDYSDSGNY